MAEKGVEEQVLAMERLPVSGEDCWKERKVKRSPRMDSSGCGHRKFPQRSHY